MTSLSHISGMAVTCAELSLKKLVMVLWPFLFLYFPFCFNWQVADLSVLINCIHLTRVAVSRVVMCFVKFRWSIFSVGESSDLEILRYYRRDCSSSDLWRLHEFILSFELTSLHLSTQMMCEYFQMDWMTFLIHLKFFCATSFLLSQMFWATIQFALKSLLKRSHCPGSFIDYIPIALLSLVCHYLG